VFSDGTRILTRVPDGAFESNPLFRMKSLLKTNSLPLHPTMLPA